MVHCVLEHGRAHRPFGPDPFTYDWTSAPASVETARVTFGRCGLPLLRTWDSLAHACHAAMPWRRTGRGHGDVSRPQRLCHGKRQHIGIRYRLPGPAALGSRQALMAEAPQDLHDWQGKVFVGVAPRHRSRCLVGLDLVLDLLLVRTGIGPRMSQILGPQCRIAPQAVGFTGAQTFRLD